MGDDSEIYYFSLRKINISRIDIGINKYNAKFELSVAILSTANIFTEKNTEKKTEIIKKMIDVTIEITSKILNIPNKREKTFSILEEKNSFISFYPLFFKNLKLSNIGLFLDTRART